jgi:hypothetical protein
VPLLARCLEQGDPPDPVDLAKAWADQPGLEGDMRERHLVTVPPASADFLGWLKNELRARDEFRSLFEERALDSIAVSSAQTEQAVQQRSRDLRVALTRAAEYQNPIYQATSEDVDATVLPWTFFGGNYASLEEFYLSPDKVFERVRVKDFVGRAWLECNLDAFLEANDRGAWVLAGEAGIGKTSFLAHLVRERSYPHFFAEQAPGESNLPRALQSLASQLISPQGFSTRGISGTLYISEYTVQRHLQNAFEKVGVRSRRELIKRLFFDNLLPGTFTD